MDQREKQGRPLKYASQDSAMDSYPVRLTATLARAARKIGCGNLSEGVRIAIQFAIDHKEELKIV